MQMCARCHKRVAVVFITKLENNQTINEGLCLKCARELGIKPVNDMLDKMGISEEDFDRMSEDMKSMFDNIPDGAMIEGEGEDGGAPAIELPKIFQNLGFGALANSNNDTAKSKEGKKSEKGNPKRKFLSTYCHNLTEQAKNGGLDKIIGRKRELDRVIQILCRRQKNNPCLIGEPGVGKTAIAEALALKIVSGDVPYKLRECEIYLVDLTALVAGTQFRGQFESRILGLISEVKAAGNIILVIDEVHNIVGAGDSEGSMNAANILKPALSRGEIQVIGATTLKEYRKYIEKDSALERRFQPVMVNEPSIDDSAEILMGIKGYYEHFHSIKIPDSIIYDAVTLSERYITDRFLPDKAIDLIDEAASHVSLSSSAISEKKDIDNQLELLGKEKSKIEAMPDSEDGNNEEKYRLMADIKVRELNLLERQKLLEEECAKISLTVNDLAEVIEIWTGVPASAISTSEFKKLESLKENILSRLVGQDTAVDAVVRAIKRKRAGVSYRATPVSFIFAGPTGVGKTELVKVLAENMFNKPEALIRLDMSEYMEKHSVSKIIGAPPGYVGYDEAGQLTEKIRRNPYSVILFDEIEKAHPDVLNILLQVLDEGQLTDASGRRVSFENCIIVMTTNAGSDKGSAISGFSESVETVMKEKTERALSQFLRPEFINRIDEIITFNKLTLDGFERIAKIMMEQLRSALKKKGIDLVYSPTLLKHIAENSFSEKYGARNMRRYIERNIEDLLASEIIAKYDKNVTTAKIEVRKNTINVLCS